MHVRADAVCIGDSRTDGVRFGDARPGRTSAATALVPVGDIARIANAGFIHSRTATASAAAHAASGGLARRRAGCIVLARAARGRHHPAVQPQTILTADLHGLLDPLEPARGPCLLGCITAHASSLAPGTLPALTSFIIESGACVSRTNRNMNADVASVNAPADAAAMPVIRHPRRTRPARCERNESCRCVKAAGANASQLPLRIPCADWIPSRLHGPSAAGMPGKSAKGEKSSRPLVNRANGC